MSFWKWLSLTPAKKLLPLQWWITLPHSLFLLRQGRLPTISRCLFALVSATFILFSESMKPNCLVLTHDRTMISLSAPWNASTVDTWTGLTSKASEWTPLSKFWICGQRNREGERVWLISVWVHRRKWICWFLLLNYDTNLIHLWFIKGNHTNSSSFYSTCNQRLDELDCKMSFCHVIKAVVSFNLGRGKKILKWALTNSVKQNGMEENPQYWLFIEAYIRSVEELTCSMPWTL